ncbi:polysaccharide deacteylase family 2 protein [Psychromarinibacter halotolerans]|uniref:Divergent polysaccharide deacetylase family protein n=1 Tax=Psychromarinibacter halotolerans TaxID=1775175 RepID=A0ABV7GP72_9RHOB|nr:polysaccharide deacteylase family 2 protein [Psychromarinibacter halotolerans]MDF0597010.1 divergent polysaccharide deacetylase family protein [Psychromarinibacter halotolerans]
MRRFLTGAVVGAVVSGAGLAPVSYFGGVVTLDDPAPSTGAVEGPGDTVSGPAVPDAEPLPPEPSDTPDVSAPEVSEAPEPDASPEIASESEPEPEPEAAETAPPEVDPAPVPEIAAPEEPATTVETPEVPDTPGNEETVMPAPEAEMPAAPDMDAPAAPDMPAAPVADTPPAPDLPAEEVTAAPEAVVDTLPEVEDMPEVATERPAPVEPEPADVVADAPEEPVAPSEDAPAEVPEVAGDLPADDAETPMIAAPESAPDTPEASAPPVIAEVPTPPAAPEEDAAGEAPVVAEAAPPATDAPAIAEPDATPDVPASVEPPEVTDAPAAPMPPEDETSDGGVEIASAEQAPATEPVPPAIVQPDAAPDAPEVSDTPAEPPAPAVEAEDDSPGFGNLAPGITTDRLPRIGAGAPEPEPEQPEAGPQPALDAFAVPFEAVPGNPLMSLVLLDPGPSRPDPAALAGLPVPLTVVVDPMQPGAADAMRAYRAAGVEVAVLAPLPEGATPADVEVAFQEYLDTVPQSVAVMDTPDARMQANRPRAAQVAEIAAATGRGIITYERGLNSALQVADTMDVPALAVFRSFDDGSESVAAMKRVLDVGAFRAGQQGSVLLVGHMRPDTIAAITEWALGQRATSVTLAPASALLKAQ